jgi:hypothetical protein
MSHTDPADPGLFGDALFQSINSDFDWDTFFNFEPEPNHYSVPAQEVSLTQQEPLSSAPQDQHGPSTLMSFATSATSPLSAESSASYQLMTDSNAIQQNQAKRGMQDFLSSFSIDESSEPPPNKRQAFSPSRRTEVAQVRKIKACQRCKMQKISAGLLHLTVRPRIIC